MGWCAKLSGVLRHDDEISWGRLLPAWGLLLLVTLCGCATPSRNRAWVADELQRRTGATIATEDQKSPPVVLADGLDEDEAVALALWQSPTYGADLMRLKAATADFAAASRIDNPRLSLLAPIGAITAAASLVAPLTSLFGLEPRTRAADLVVSSVASSLVQSGLDLVRDVRTAHVDAIVAKRRLVVLEGLYATARDVARIARVRADAGETNPSEALALEAEAALALDELARGERDVVLTRARLANLLGETTSALPKLVSDRSAPRRVPALAALLQVAQRGRPDVQAAKLEMEGAAARAGWERSRVVGLSLQTDLQWDTTKVGARVGGVVDLPVFNQNQGGVGRAEADVQAAHSRAIALAQQVSLEVATARTNLLLASRSLARYQDHILPPLEAALAAQTRRFRRGDDSFLIVLDAQRRLGTARLREVELDADVRRARVTLERAVGARLEVSDP